MYIITRYLAPWVYQLQGLTAGVSQFFMTIFITFGTPQIQEKFKWRRRRQVQSIVGSKISLNENMERIQL